MSNLEIAVSYKSGRLRSLPDSDTKNVGDKVSLHFAWQAVLPVHKRHLQVYPEQTQIQPFDDAYVPKPLFNARPV